MTCTQTYKGNIMTKLLNRNQYSSGILALLFLLSACGKEKSNTYRVINNSNHEISQLSFSGVTNGKNLSLNVNDTSELFSLTYRRRIRLAPKLICISVDSFSNSGSFNVKYQRPCVAFSNKDVDNDLNTIILTSEENGDTITFSISLN